MEETTKDRIMLYLQHAGLSQHKFEALVGVSNGYVNNLKANPSAAVLQKILCKFPDINRVWLTSGEGAMIVSTEKSSHSSSPHGPFVGQVRHHTSSPVEVVIPKTNQKENNESRALLRAIEEISELRKTLDKVVESNKQILDKVMSDNKELNDRLLNILEQITNPK